MPGPVEAVEALWLDPTRWPVWIDGLARVASVTPDWPATGAVVEWDSRPGGRGRVRERVVAPLEVEVEDAQLSGTQSATFEAETHGSVRVRLLLAYDLKDANPFTPLVDALYIRRALRASLQRSLARFAQERIADSELGG